VPPLRHRFQSPQTTQTLAQGLTEYFEANPSLKRASDLPSFEAKQFFHSHDTVHVLYGCGTTMPDEAIVKLSSLFGTTGGLGVLRGYALHAMLDVYTQLPLLGTAVAILASPYLIVRTVWRCMRQSRRWPWVEHEHFMNTPLNELRQQFRIRVAHERSAV
jgi:ubiquinone biosynthesis protein Coq4